MGLSMSTRLSVALLECFPYDSSLLETDRLGKGCIRVAPHRSSSNFVRGHGKSAVIPLFTCCWRSRRRP